MMKTPATAPSLGLALLELRAVSELAAFFALAPLLRSAPYGDGHPVLVLPGLAAGDASTLPLRSFLRYRGYAAHGWKLGTNCGPRPGVEAKMRQRLIDLAQTYDRKVSLVGWSLGGVFAREMSRSLPQHVRGVITLGSGFNIEPTATNARFLFEGLSGTKIEDWPERERMKQPPPVPTTSIYSRSDGVVAWQGCLETEGPQTENIEVASSHIGLGFNPAVLCAIADRLAQSEGDWRPFDRSGIRSIFFPDPRCGADPLSTLRSKTTRTGPPLAEPL